MTAPEIRPPAGGHYWPPAGFAPGTEVRATHPVSPGGAAVPGLCELSAPERLAIAERRAEPKLQGLEEVSVYQSVVIDRLGTRIPIEIRSTPIRRDGKVIALHAVMRDLTERNRVETALRESEERFRLAFDPRRSASRSSPCRRAAGSA